LISQSGGRYLERMRIFSHRTDRTCLAQPASLDSFTVCDVEYLKFVNTLGTMKTKSGGKLFGADICCKQDVYYEYQAQDSHT
jgi:hypothetical protein